MCGRYTLHTAFETLQKHFQVSNQLKLIPRFNIAPSQSVAAVRMGTTDWELAMLTWGLVPFWAKDKKIGYRTINARAETVASKPAFRAAFRQRRCLIPADGFYEWKSQPGGKQPFYIRLKNKDVFAFAGLWEQWKSETGETLESCTIIVTDANELVRSIHDRMPVILNPNDYETWLNPSENSADHLSTLLKPYPPDQMVAYSVGRGVNNPRHDSPTCIEPNPLCSDRSS
jgi:putative SOS response-associated peptidase YedK